MNRNGLVRYLRYAVHGETVHRRRRRRNRRCRPARDWKYRAWIRSLPSAISGMTPCEAAHTGNDGGTSMKASDYSCIPLAWSEHAEYHRIGRAAFELVHQINCRELVKRLNHDWFAYAREVKENGARTAYIVQPGGNRRPYDRPQLRAYHGVVYRVEFYCPRSGKLFWQPLTSTLLLFFTQPRQFPDQQSACQVADSLIWQYHSARVIDPWGNVVYQV